MVSGFFKPGWQSDSASKRQSAIQAMDYDDGEQKAIIQSIAQEDPDADVRKVALNKINDLGLLFELSQSHPQPSSCEDAEIAFAAHLNQAIVADDLDLESLCTKHPNLRFAIAKHASQTEIRNKFILALNADQQVNLIAEATYIDSRALIAETLQEEVHLQNARKQISGKDKNAERIIRNKLDSIHKQQRQDQENLAEAQLICEKIEFLASHDLRPETKAQHSIWSQRWQQLAFTIDSHTLERYALANTRVEAALAQQEILDAALATQQALASDLMQECYGVAKYSMQEHRDHKQASTERLQVANKQWAESCTSSEPEQSISLQFTHAKHALENAIAFAEQLGSEVEPSIQSLGASIACLSWPSQYPEFSAKSEVETELNRLKKEQAAEQKEQTEKLDKLHKRINRLLGSTKKGDLPRARRELGAISKAVDKYEGKTKAALDERVKQASEAVVKMSDWVDFATEPKLLELCEKMEALLLSKAHPDKLSTEINELQQQWKSLVHCDSADKHWPRFKQAADKAYEPCALFFKQRRETRQKNLKSREPLVAQMRNLLESTAWDESPDYKAVENELQSIHNAWQKIKDVEPGPGQKQWNKLSKLRASVYEKLDVVYDANIAAKNQLIEQLKKMLDSELQEESLAKLQLYQNKWKQVGVTRRKQDQAAWKKFKKTSDAVYQKIQGLRKERRSAEDEKIDAYRQIIKDINHLAKKATDLADSDQRFSQLEEQYKQLPELPQGLPEKLVKGLAMDYRRAGDFYAKARQRIKGNKRKEQVHALANKAALCSQLEQCAHEADAEKIEELQLAMHDIEITNKNLAKQFEQRVAAALDVDRSDATQARKLFCIDLEILLGVDSPAEDAALRMQIQLDRMKSKGIGHAQKHTSDTINKAKNDWLCLPGADSGKQAGLDQRFEKIVSSKSKK